MPTSLQTPVFCRAERMFSRLQVVVVTLWVSLLLCRVSSAPRGDLLFQLLRSQVDPKENELQDLSRLLLLKQLSESVTPEEKDALDSIDELDVRNEVVRQIPVSQRERKAGCRNFYWKTFTSC
ncbi:somatostatin-1 [Danio rerio]|uniref:Somatostatin-1 n=1 Tax=Danio rerio TaxID=7955 RepID=A0A8M9PRQ6_DANRE|nr:somatostatin-1-like [Danio rerio]XP_021327559.1 somatostatin-1-like [Danio rerio]|eukprot:XP_001333082.2 somatostatin-1-like [Danio rerio]